MGIRVLLGFVLVAFASVSMAADDAAKGYSIELVSASPSPGTIVGVGQTVEFKITVSYQLSVAETGLIFLVVQDETNKNLLGDRKAQSQSVARGKGTTTLTDSFVVPAGSNEVRVFIPLVPSGMTHTDGEVVVHYVVRDVHVASSIGYSSVAAALKDLRSKPEINFSEQNGWVIADDRSHFTIWTFAPAGNPAFPSVVKRTAVQSGEGVRMSMEVRCESTVDACDKLVADFNVLNDRAVKSLKSK